MTTTAFEEICRIEGDGWTAEIQQGAKHSQFEAACLLLKTKLLADQNKALRGIQRELAAFNKRARAGK